MTNSSPQTSFAASPLDDFLLSEGTPDSALDTTNKSARTQSKFSLTRYQPVEVFRLTQGADLEICKKHAEEIIALINTNSSKVEERYKNFGNALIALAKLIDSTGQLINNRENPDPKLADFFLALTLKHWSDAKNGTAEFEIFSEFKDTLKINILLSDWQKLILKHFDIAQLSAIYTLPTLLSAQDLEEYTQTMSVYEILKTCGKLEDDIKFLNESTSAKDEDKKKNLEATKEKLRESLAQIREKSSDIFKVAQSAYKKCSINENAAQTFILKQINAKRSKNTTGSNPREFLNFSSSLNCKLILNTENSKALIKFSRELKSKIEELTNYQTGELDIIINAPSLLGATSTNLGLKIKSNKHRLLALDLALELYAATRIFLATCTIALKDFPEQRKTFGSDLLKSLESPLPPETLTKLLELGDNSEEFNPKLQKRILELYRFPEVVQSRQDIECSFDIFNIPQLTGYLLTNLVKQNLEDKAEQDNPELKNLIRIALSAYEQDYSFIGDILSNLKKNNFTAIAKSIYRRIKTLKEAISATDSFKANSSPEQIALSLSICINTIAAIAAEPSLAKQIRLQIPNIDNLTEFLDILANYSEDPSFFKDQVKKIKKSLSNTLQDAPLSPENMKKVSKAIRNFQYLIKHPELAASSTGDELFASGIFLPGAPGIGKTYFIKCLENEIGGPRIDISLMSYIKKALEAGEDFNLDLIKVILLAFSEVISDDKKNEPVMIVVDEAEAILVNRLLSNITQEQMTSNNLMLQIISDIRINYPNVFIVIATNHKDKVDKASIRRGRIDIEIELSDPSPEIRKIVIRSEIMKALEVANFDLELEDSDLAEMVKLSDGLQFVEIKQTINELIRFEWSMARDKNPDFKPEIMELVSRFKEIAGETSQHSLGDISRVGFVE